MGRPPRGVRPRYRSVLVAVVLAWVSVAQAAERKDSFVDFIYVDANEGSASGGHVALRLGDRTYHFGYRPPGLLRLDRDDSDRFAHVYGVLENRNLQVLRTRVSRDTFERVRSAFNERFLLESLEFDALEQLGRDRALLASWARGEAQVTVRGGGYLELEPSSGSTRTGGRALARVRQRAEGRYGTAHLEALEKAARDALHDLARDVEARVVPLAAPGQHPGRGYGLARSASEAQSLVEALKAVRSGAVLRSDAKISSPPPLEPAFLRVLDEYRIHLEDRVVERLAAPPSDAGYSLLVSLARLAALEETLSTGRLVVLDVFPPDGVRWSREQIEALGGDLDRLSTELETEVGLVVEALSNKSRLRESDYGAFEGLVNRWVALNRARDLGEALPVAVGRLRPERLAVRALPFERLESGVLQARDAELAAREADLFARLDAEHHYNLLAHNCVSELFVQLERSVAREGVDPSRSSTEALGGHVLAGDGLQFIPFVARDAVADAYGVEEIVDVPSYRRRRAASVSAHDGWLGGLRESTTFTSSVYAPNSVDSAFVFFTDDRVWSRPLFGAVNLLYGLASAVVGAPLAVADEGRTLSAGLRGALWSVPELGFVNVRKGSFFFVTADSAVPDSPER